MQSTKSSKIPFRRVALRAFGISALLATVVPLTAHASSHREAPFITKNPQVDGTDFYMFRSYDTAVDKSAFTTIIANYEPLQDAYGGPNYFNLDPDALYEIEIDNNGDGVEDLTFQFQFSQSLGNGGAGISVPVSDAGTVPVPLTNIGDISDPTSTGNLNVLQSYTVGLVTGPRRGSAAKPITNHSGGSATFAKPVDNIGVKSFGTNSYAEYASHFVYSVDIPGCSTQAQLFVGQRAESFAVNLGPIFDLVDAPKSVVTGQAAAGGGHNGGPDVLDNPIGKKNVTSLELQIPTTCLLSSPTQPIIGGWTTASVRQARVVNPGATYTVPSKEGGAWTQVSRLGSPLVNEVVIGVPDKDHWNASEPKDDAQFAKYVEYPTLPVLIDALFGPGLAPTLFPRADLVEAFLTGIPGVNAVSGGVAAEELRLNTAVPVTHQGSQDYLGAATCVLNGAAVPNPLPAGSAFPGCDPAGFPNGRRPGDDVVDIALDAVEGALLPKADAPAYAGANPTLFTDGVQQKDSQFDDTFPYLKTPNQGANGDGS
jgi:hypothetical protein